MRWCGRLLLMVVLLAGCDDAEPGPPTTRSESSHFASLPEKVAHLERYVKFRRTFLELDFWIDYRQGEGGFIPAPTEWDIRLVAKVPPSELALWIPASGTLYHGPTDWLAAVPTSLPTDGITQWFEDGSRLVGLDPDRSIVAYRNRSR